MLTVKIRDCHHFCDGKKYHTEPPRKAVKQLEHVCTAIQTESEAAQEHEGTQARHCDGFVLPENGEVVEQPCR